MRYLIEHFGEVAGRFGEHLRMTLIALVIALVIAVPIGVLITRFRRWEVPVMGLLGILYTIPSLALLVLLSPFVGLGLDNAVIVLVIYAQVILVRNIVGLNGVDPAIVEAASGMGMSGWQRLTWIEMPLALPVILAGIRSAMVTVIGIGTVAALINAGGIGRLLFDGVSTSNPQKIIAGSIAAATLAGLANVLLRVLERRAQRTIYGDE